MAADPAQYVKQKLDIDVPWAQLVGSSNLQTVLHAIVQRLDRHDQALATSISPNLVPDSKGFTVIANKDLTDLKHRLSVIENTTLQHRVEQLKKESPLKAAAANANKGLKLAEHVIPLTAMKTRIEGCEVGIQANAEAVDATNNHISEVATALHQELEEALAKMATKEELRAVEDRVDELQAKVDSFDAKFEELEDKIVAVEKQVERTNARVDAIEERVDRTVERINQVEEIMQSVQTAVEELEKTKADREELQALEVVVEELKAAVEAIDLEALSDRIDLMDERCDKIEDNHEELRKSVLRWQKEMEDLQLEKQIENLRRELEEAKTGVFMKATARMDEMQKETNELRVTVTGAQGLIQVNRENIEELEDVIRAGGGGSSNPTAPNGTRALIEQLQADIAKLEMRYAEAAQREVDGQGKAEETQERLHQLRSKMEELANAKADRISVEQALLIKADKDAVARDTERNLRAVDEALTVMNAGTQGVQQLLERQEGAVAEISAQLANKPDREEIERIKEKLAAANSSLSAEELQQQAEAVYGRYGNTVEDAAGMSRHLEPYNCISCNRPLRPTTANPLPSLPLLPATKDPRPPYIPGRRVMSARVRASSPNSYSQVDVQEMPRSLRSAGGTATTPRYLQHTRQNNKDTVEVPTSGKKPVTLVGEDGRIYHGRADTS
eukprot:TRINITY_DN7839_c0_g1_i3.p1 TRINITY_DN7839_c0_g1~~TRINITY_DN7839_c0_g1_i3.p1  ORF type:complete len:675 (+),score=205.44 TRINITY_DN7839_c0_g1_i3:172-2196(+)